MLGSLLRRGTRAVLIVSETPAEPLLEAALLRQPHIRLLESLLDDGAIDMALREKPDLIVEDLAPPGEAGLALCRELSHRAGTRSIPVILVVPQSLCLRAHEAGAEVVLGKPLEPGQFFDAVRRFVPLPERAPRLQVNLRFTFRVGSTTAQAFSRDLSERGAFLKTDRRLPPGTRLDLRFCIPGLAEEVRCDAVVRSASETLHPSAAGGIGIEFQGLSDHERALLATYLEHQA